MLRYLTAGESHGRGLLGIIEGLPAGLHITADWVNGDLERRQGGYGRGGRMAIERDQVEFVSGVRHGRTIGSPVGMLIWNRDWPNWEEEMSPAPGVPIARVTTPRPGHADLAGTLKYLAPDMRDVLERASARATAMRVAVGSVARRFLDELGITVLGHVRAIGAVAAKTSFPPDRTAVMNSPVYCQDEAASKRMVAAIETAAAQGDTLGGVIEVCCWDVPVGLGSHVQWDRRLDGLLGQALLSVPGIKAVEVGDGWDAATKPGSQVHDHIHVSDRGLTRPTNHAGGIEGGISNGMPLVVRAAMKPIPTLREGLPSVDLDSGRPTSAPWHRSDVCAVPAASVVCEAVVAFVVAGQFLARFGGDSMAAVQASFKAQQALLAERFPRVYD